VSEIEIRKSWITCFCTAFEKVALRRQVGTSPRRNGFKLRDPWMGSKFGIRHLRHRAAQVLEHSAERLPASFYMRGTGEDFICWIYSTFQNDQKSHAVCIQQSSLEIASMCLDDRELLPSKRSGHLKSRIILDNLGENK